MAGAHPVLYTLPNQPCNGLVESDADIPLRLDAGVYKKTVDNARIAAKLTTVQRADAGQTPNRCTIEYAGVLRFKMPDSATLSNADKEKGVKGAASGAIKLVAYTTTYDPNLTGRVVDFSNQTGDKWVDVLMPAQ